MSERETIENVMIFRERTIDVAALGNRISAFASLPSEVPDNHLLKEIVRDSVRAELMNTIAHKVPIEVQVQDHGCSASARGVLLSEAEWQTLLRLIRKFTGGTVIVKEPASE